MESKSVLKRKAIQRGEGLSDGLACPECRSTSIAHFNLEFQEATHRTMCHDCKLMADGMSFEESDANFQVAS